MTPKIAFNQRKYTRNPVNFKDIRVSFSNWQMWYILRLKCYRGANSQSNETSYYFLGKLYLRCLTKFYRGGSRAAATSNMERFVIIVNSILDIAAALDPPLVLNTKL